MKTKEELAIIKEEYDDLKEKLAELTDEELDIVTGGNDEPSNYEIEHRMNIRMRALLEPQRTN